MGILHLFSQDVVCPGPVGEVLLNLRRFSAHALTVFGVLVLLYFWPEYHGTTGFFHESVITYT